MKVITVARKPLSGTVAKNALEHGTGGMNIDRSRLGTSESLNGGAYAVNPSPRPNPEDWRFKRGGARSKLPGDNRDAGMIQEGSRADGGFQQPSGRWPANLILEHHAECVKTGTQKVEGHKITHYDGDKANRAYGFYIPDRDGADQKSTNAQRQADIEVDVYDCHPDCPCVKLDEQSGTAGGGYGVRGASSHIYGGGKGFTAATGESVVYGDSGGASRFFKQVSGHGNKQAGGEPIDTE